MVPSKEALLEMLRDPKNLDDETRRLLAEALRTPVGHQPRMTYLSHQSIAKFLTGILDAYQGLEGLGVVVPAPFQMKLAHTSREPDLIFVKAAHLDRLEPTYLDGPADLVVEIVSPESVGRDRGEKFYEYEEAGIPEYWLLDPQVKRAEFYQLGGAGQYQLATLDEAGRYHSSQLPGFWLKVAWLWQAPPPPTDETMMEIGGQAYAERVVQKLRQRGLLGRK